MASNITRKHVRDTRRRTQTRWGCSEGSPRIRAPRSLGSPDFFEAISFAICSNPFTYAGVGGLGLSLSRVSRAISTALVAAKALTTASRLSFLNKEGSVPSYRANLGSLGLLRAGSVR